MVLLSSRPHPGQYGDPFVDYRKGQTLLSSPRGVLLADTNDCAPLPVRNPLDLTSVLRSADQQLAVGALPFDPAVRPHLVAPRQVHRLPPANRHPLPALPAVQGRYTVRPVPAPDHYEAAVARAVRQLANRDLDKVVLARTLRITCAQPINLNSLVQRLATADPTGYAFALALPHRTFVGASPELLVSRTGNLVVSNPLAGSRRRHPEANQDRQAGRELLASEKDRHEHRFVVDTVAEALRPYCRHLNVPTDPILVSTASMWHLSTRITGELADPTTCALTLARALQPTPAVCGTPTSTAHTLIQRTEPFERGYYTGAVGWQDTTGDGEWIVAIRCAEVTDHTLRLFAGAGIVAASDPAAELAETTAKFRAVLNALGIEEQH